jgi:hypothetical protein
VATVSLEESQSPPQMGWIGVLVWISNGVDLMGFNGVFLTEL